MKFQPVRPKKVSAQIAEQIRSSILGGEFSPGDRLPPERELAEMFGVSRPTLREAINVLAAAGLVESYQGGGTIVKSLVETADGPPLSSLIRQDAERALDVIEVRKEIEASTGYYAARRALPEDIRTLERIVEGLRSNLDGYKPSENLDASFHLAIARSTHNFVWLHLMETLFDAMREFQKNVWRAVYLTPEDHHTLFEHHTRIFTAIRDHDSDGARQAMLDHLRFAEQKSADYVALRTKEREQA
jgi:GntR family transcriptional repressor for pyruvate dehydrogenase complex